MYLEIAKVLFVINMIFLLRPLILSRVLYKEITFLGTLKRLINFLVKIPVEFLRMIFLRQIKWSYNIKEDRIFSDIYKQQVIFIGFGNHKLGLFFNIIVQLLMIIFFLIGVFD